MSKDSGFLYTAGVSFINVPLALFRLRSDHGFSHTESFLAMFLFQVSHWKHSFEFSKSYSEIAKESGLSKRKVIDCVTKMVHFGVLAVASDSNKKNVYTWNVGFLQFAGANGSPREVKTVHLKGENGSPCEVKTVHHIYISFFKEVFKDSHKEFFSEVGGGYFKRIPPTKKSKPGIKKVAEDSAASQNAIKKVFVSRHDEWNRAIESVLKKSGNKVWVNTYVALKSKFDPKKTLFPKRYLETLQNDHATQWQYRKENGEPLHLECDESFFEYLKTDKTFLKFLEKEKGQNGTANEVH